MTHYLLMLLETRKWHESVRSWLVIDLGDSFELRVNFGGKVGRSRVAANAEAVNAWLSFLNEIESKINS